MWWWLGAALQGCQPLCQQLKMVRVLRFWSAHRAKSAVGKVDTPKPIYE